MFIKSIAAEEVGSAGPPIQAPGLGRLIKSSISLRLPHDNENFGACLQTFPDLVIL